VFWECTWCHQIFPESDERIKRQLERHKLPFMRMRSLVVYCPRCGAPMQRRVYKDKVSRVKV